ncbi:MAG TPA: hypothetical protein PLU22_07545, partial [Polyangiaceae bacterium]|nr:hypothetical protein [Polyangiaceae bacterium]
SYRQYTSKFGQDQDATPIAVAQLDNELNHHAFTSELRLNFKSGSFLEGTVGAFYLDQKGTYTARVDLNLVATERGAIVEIQGTAEGEAIPRAELDAMMDLALRGVSELCRRQREALAGAGVDLGVLMLVRG